MTISSFVLHIVFVVHVILYTSSQISASKESAEACAVAAEALNDIPSISNQYGLLLERYNETCADMGLCDIDLDEHLETLWGHNARDVDYIVKNYPIKMKTSLDFGGSFADDPSFSQLVNACEDAGGYMECVDAILYVDGAISGMLFGSDGDENDIVLDVEIFAKSLPYCFPPSCKDEDLTQVIEDGVRDAVLKTTDAKSALDPASEALLKTITFKQLCALTGLPTCQLSVTAVDCSYNSSSNTPNIGIGYSLPILAAISSSLFLFT